MICASAKFFLLLFTVAATTSGSEFEELEESRFPPSKTVTPSIAATNSYSHQKREENQRDFPITEDTYVKQRNGTLDSLENETSLQKVFKLDLKFFFKEVKICRESHSYMSNEVFKQKLYCFLLDELNGITKENLEEDFHCNISKKTIDEVKGMEHLLAVFKRIFLLNLNNNSCESSQEQAVGSHAIGLENLKLKLGDEWIPLEPKVSHMSHIYLGTSVYPILTEESWVIEKDYTSKSAASTKSTYPKEIGLNPKETELQSQTKSATKIYQLLTPIHWRKDSKQTENEPRSSRSLYAVGSKSLISNGYSEEKLSTQKTYSSNSATVAITDLFNSTNTTSDDGAQSIVKKDAVRLPQNKHKNQDPFRNAVYFLYNSFVKLVKNGFKSG